MGPTWVLSAPGGPHVGPMNLAIRDNLFWYIIQSSDAFLIALTSCWTNCRRAGNLQCHNAHVTFCKVTPKFGPHKQSTSHELCTWYGAIIPVSFKVTSLPLNNMINTYHQISNIRCTSVGNKFVDHSDVVGAVPVGAAPTTSSFST